MPEWDDPYRLGGPRSPWADPHRPAAGPSFGQNLRAGFDEMLPFLTGATELGLSVAPGSGEVMSLQDYNDAMNRAAEDFGQGNILSALGNTAEGIAAGIGAIPIGGMVARGIRSGTNDVVRMVESAFGGVPKAPELSPPGWTEVETGVLPEQTADNLSFRDVSVRPDPASPLGLSYEDPLGVTSTRGPLPPPGFNPPVTDRLPTLGELRTSLGMLQGRYEREAISNAMGLPPDYALRSGNDLGRWALEENNRLGEELGFGPEELGPNGFSLEQINRIAGNMLGSVGFGGKVGNNAGAYGQGGLDQVQDVFGRANRSLIWSPNTGGPSLGGSIHLAPGEHRSEEALRKTSAHELGHAFMGLRDKQGTMDAMRTIYLPRLYGRTSPDSVRDVWREISGELMVNSVRNSRQALWQDRIDMSPEGWQHLMDGDTEFAENLLQLRPPDRAKRNEVGWDYLASDAELLADGLGTIILDPTRARAEMPTLTRVVGEMARDPQIRQHVDMTKLFPILLAGAALGIYADGESEARANNPEAMLQ